MIDNFTAYCQREKEKKKLTFHKNYAELKNEPLKEYAINSGFEMAIIYATFCKRNVYPFVCHFMH